MTTPLSSVAPSTQPTSLRTWAFWRDLLIFFLVFSWLGHWLEMLIIALGTLINPELDVAGIFNHWLEPYHVYGFAAVAIILLFRALPRKVRTNLPAHFLINTLVCAVIEYLTALAILWRFGHRFWDYSDQFLNLNGHICLLNSLFFGVLATLFSFWLYPFLDRHLQRVSGHVRNFTAAWLSLAMIVAMVLT
jgi:uncharacterized membrane protein